MKKFYGLLGAIALVAMSACTADELAVGGDQNQDGEGRYAYINAKIALPSAGSRSRSATDEGKDGNEGETNSNGSSNSGNTDTDSENPTVGDDFEYGYDFENDVRSMILVLADAQDRYLTHIVVTGMTQASTTGESYVFSQITRIPYKTLEEAYGEGGLFDKLGAEPEMHLYAFCNFTNNMLTQYSEYQQKVFNTPVASRDDDMLTEWREFKGSVVEKASQAGQVPQSTSTIWSPRSFLMSNAKLYKSKFPATIGEWDQYADDRNPLDLTEENGPIDVERVSARIDFRDASEKGDQVYPIRLKVSQLAGETKPDKEELNLYSVKLTRMVLVNMSKEFYYLRRVSDDGTMTTPTYAGKETPRNYVVDTDYAKKLEEQGITPENAEEHFNFPLYNSEANEDGKYSYNNIGSTYGWYVDDIEDVLNGKYDDNWNGSQQYKIWRYVTENTIPSIDQQKTVQSIGIIFKGALVIGEDYDATYNDGVEPYLSESIVDALNAVKEQPAVKPDNLPAIYSFHNMLYAGVADIVEAAKRDGEGGSLFFAVDQILGNWYAQGQSHEFKYFDKKPEGDYVQLNVVIADEILNQTEVTDGTIDYTDGKVSFKINEDDEYDTQFIKLAPEQEITVYVPSNDDNEGWGYYCYYFYWNRHNDNGLSGKMGLMEFASVRNNVYKLAVTKINALGHPRDTTHDPDPVDPEDPDEEPERSIEIQVNVLPWVVRVNDIEF